MSSDLRFWLGKDAHTKVFACVERIARRTGARRAMNAYHAALYDDVEAYSSAPGAYEARAFDPEILAFNLVRKNVNTLTARIAKSRPLPMAVTEGGSFSEQRRAKRFNAFIEGCFDEHDVFATSRTVARDAMLFGTGLSYTYRVGDKVHHDRILIDELRVDPREAQHGKPRSIYLARWVDKLVMKERYKRFSAQIETSTAPNGEALSMTSDDACDLVFVVEAWHLPSGPGAKDGCHVIAVSDATLLREEYTRDRFPISVMRASDPLVGFFGTGLAKELTGLQFVVNELAEVIQEKMRNTGGHVLVEKGSTVEAGQIDNGPRSVLFYQGVKPDWVEPAPLHPDIMNVFQSFMRMDSDVTLVSQMSMQSQIPAGLANASGAALARYDDIESDRFLLISRAFEEYHLDVAWQFFDCAEQIANDNGSYTVRAVVKARGTRSLQPLDFKEVKLDRDSFKLFVFPTSFLAKQPSMRIAQVQQLANAGWLSPEESKVLLEFPDLEQFQAQNQAGTDIIDSLIERFLSAEDPDAEGVYVFPEPYFNLAACITRTQNAYLRAKLEPDTDDEELFDARLELLRRFITDAAAELKKQATQTGAVVAAAQGQGAPPAAAS